MQNMSKNSKSLFYKYLSDKINNFFYNNNNIEPGSSYYLQFDKDEDVTEFYKVLKNLDNTSDYINGYYQSFTINSTNTNKILVAAASKELEVTEDYLVRIRNIIKDTSENTSNLSVLFIFCNYDLDSITKGAQYLLDQGMPLEFKKLIEEMSNDIQNSKLENSDKKIVNYDIHKKLEDSYQTSIFDLERDLNYINKEKLEIEDFNEMGLFQDTFNKELSDSSTKQRCDRNSELFEKLMIAHSTNTAKDIVDRDFIENNKLSRSLKNEERWKDCEFTEVLDNWNSAHKTGPKIAINSDILVDENKNLSIIDNPKSSSSNGLKTRNLIIFNSNFEKTIQIIIPYNLALPTNSEITIIDNDTVINGKTKNMTQLVLETTIDPTQTCFKKIQAKIGKKKSVNFIFNICYLPMESNQLKIEKGFSINPKVTNPSIQISYFENSLYIGNQNNLMDVPTAEELAEEDFTIPQGKGIELTPSLIEMRQEISSINESSILEINNNECLIPLTFTYSVSPKKRIKLNDIILKKINSNSSAERNGKFILLNGSNLEITSDNELLKIKLEEEMIRYIILFGKCGNSDNSNILAPIDIQVPPSILQSYLDIVNYFKSNKQCPLTCKITQELLNLYEAHINNYKSILSDIRDKNCSLFNYNEEKLLLLGSLLEGNNIVRFTSFNIVSIIHQYIFYSKILENNSNYSKELFDPSIFGLFNGCGLLPLFSIKANDINESYNSNKTYTYNCASEDQSGTWLKYVRINKYIEDESNRYLDQIVSSKLIEFKRHYTQLFDINKNLPITINAIKLGNNLGFLKGILKYIKGHWNNNAKEIQTVPITVNFYSDNNDTSVFDHFLGESDILNIIHILPPDLFKVQGYDEREILRKYQQSIKYYQYRIKIESLKSAHITFINNDNNDTTGIFKINSIPTGISLNGLISSISSYQEKNTNNTLFGFGIEDSMIESSEPLKTIKYLNEYACAISNNSSELKDNCITLQSSNAANNFINSIYNISEWVTFINPHFGLDYFYNFSDLMIIHYSDQLQNSENYDAITVTKKTEIFEQIIRKELIEKSQIGTGISDEEVNRFITLTTCINGNWLLDLMINENNPFKTRASFSEIATYKIMMSFLKHPDIIWVPVSMEEIIRIAFDQKIGDKSIFSELKKHLELTSNKKDNKCYSDDLLMIGIEKSNLEDLKVHIFPVEVKASNALSYSELEKKGKLQTHQTIKLLNEALIDYKEERKPISKAFFRQFFMNITLINARKLSVSKAIDFDLSELTALRSKLLNNKFTITKSVNKLIGDGCVTIFSSKNYYCEYEINDENIAIFRLPLDYMEQDVLNNLSEIRSSIINGKYDALKYKCISEIYTEEYRNSFVDNLESEVFNEENLVDNEDIENENPEKITPEPISNEDPEKYPNQPTIDNYKVVNQLPIHNASTYTKFIPPIASKVCDNTDAFEEVRILLGQKPNGENVYWEYGNKNLANKHALITGKSGYGKSYAIECILLEFAKNKIDSIIIDFSESFVDGKLEPIFKEALNTISELKQIDIIFDKININPFKSGYIEVGDRNIPENSSNVADRFRNVITKIYGLGPQQSTTIYTCVKDGIDEHGDKMTLNILRDMLEKKESTKSETVLSRLVVLFDNDPFNYTSPIDWKDYNKRNGVCHLFELQGFQDDLKKVITEFILWDIWNYKILSSSNKLPLPIILDEMHNLTTDKKSPVYKILNEGRKHNISGIFITQDILSRFDKNFVNSVQNTAGKLYFFPPEEITNKVATFLNKADNRIDTKEWANALANLPKGSCISNSLEILPSGKAITNAVSKIHITSLGDRFNEWKEKNLPKSEIEPNHNLPNEENKVNSNLKNSNILEIPKYLYKDSDTKKFKEDILDCIDQIQNNIFTLPDLYIFEKHLSVRHPENDSIKRSIRKNLEELKDDGYLQFITPGKYKKLK
jgi:DNA phosphorothioation-dependent restriction protein DptH